MKKVPIIVIDDEAAIHRAFNQALGANHEPSKALLEGESAIFGESKVDEPIFVVFHAHSGEEGIMMVRKAVEAGEPFPVAFLDVRMPGLDGLDTAHQLFEIDPAIQIVFCTAYNDRTLVEFRQLGYLDQWLILKKPFDRVEVLQLACALSAKWKLVRELIVTRAVAESANRAKSEFLANMSHEIRTPMHAITSFLKFALDDLGIVSTDDPSEAAERLITEMLLSTKKKGEEEKGSYDSQDAELLKRRLSKLPDHLLRVLRNVDVLSCLINDLLDLAKIEAGQMDFSFKRENLPELFQNVSDQCNSLLDDKRLKLQIEADGEFYVDVDLGKITQVFRNLLSNAVKFSPNGGTIIARFAADMKSVVSSLTDFGPGIPLEELEAIFDKFHQSTRTASGLGGTGLGLLICREYVMGHGGKIWAESNQDGGSTFFVELPLTQKN